jgi:hypothetical protein
MTKSCSYVAIVAGYLLITAVAANAAMLTNGAGFTGPPFGGYTCADVRGGRPPPTPTGSTPVQAWDCHGWFNQQWTLNRLQIFGIGSIGGPVSSQTCLDVHFGGTAPGTPVDLAFCNGTQAQNWIYDGGQLINIHGTSSKCLDAGSRVNGTQLFINRCNGSDSQQWQIK